MPTTADRPFMVDDTPFTEWNAAQELFSTASNAEIMSAIGQFMPKDTPTHGYFRNRKNGYITIYEINAHARLRATEQRGWDYLKDYGGFPLMPAHNDDPHEVLFLRGGAKEMTVAQIEECGYHYHPPLLPTCGLQLGQRHREHKDACYRGAKPVVFPQLADRVYPEKPVCEHGCGENRWFTSTAARDQHYRVMHEKELSEQAQGRALAAGVREALVSVQTATIQSSGIKPFVCGQCEYENTDPNEFVTHLLTHAEREPEPEIEDPFK